jgi:hypothetical protein
VSQPDSFIDEVTDEVRRDRLFATFRKYGWIGIAVVLLTVGGTAYSEWQKSRTRAEAQGFGDAILAALDAEAPEARRSALEAIPATGDKAAIKQLLLASDPVQDKAGSLAALAVIEADASLPQVYRDMAVLRRVILQGADAPLADRRAALEAIAAPGRAFRPLALEQMAYLLVEEGKPDQAIAALEALTEDQEAPSGLRQRATQMIVALGGGSAAEG